MSTAITHHGARRPTPCSGPFFFHLTPNTRLLRLPERCGTGKLRRLWNACFPLRA